MNKQTFSKLDKMDPRPPGLQKRYRDGMRADLTRANLSGTDLRGADLLYAVGKFATANLGLHDAVAAGGYILIGCERHTYAHWLNNYREIGRKNGYSEEEIARYGTWIEMTVAWLGEK